jgi:hypothetical protein
MESTVADIKVGDFVKVPKGTTVYPNDSSDSGEPNSRDLTVEVRAIVDYGIEDRWALPWLVLLPAEERVDPRKAQQYGVKPGDANYVMWSTRYSDSDIKADPALRQRLKERVIELVGSMDLRAVEWSTKRAMLVHVQPTAAPVKKERVITLKQKMVKNSRWRFPADADLVAIKDNPRYSPAVQAFWAQHPSPPYKHQKPGKGTFTDLHVYLDHHGITQYVDYVYARVKAGQEFRVTGKMRTSYPDNGHLVPVRFDGSTKDQTLTYSSIKDLVEELEVPVVRVFVLRNRDTGEVFSEWRDRWYVDEHRGNAPVMTTDWRKMRKFDDTGKLKQFILEFSGYYKDMPINDDRAYWQEPSQTKIMDLPENWEAVAYDKLAKTPLEAVDVQKWYAQAWRLRSLTMTFGSPVRTLYKTLENKDELDKYKGMLVIRMPTEEWRGAQHYTEEASEEDLASIDDLIDSLGLKRGQFRKTKDKFGAAVTFETSAQALLAKLKYQGNLRLNVINLDKMQEVLD